MSLRDDIESDRDAIDDLDLPAIYRPVSDQAGDGYPVGVKLTIEAERLQLLRGGRMSSPGRTHDARVYRMMVPRVISTEVVADGAAVGDAGGVVDLRVGDTFTVAAADAGDAGDGTRVLRVTGGVVHPTGAAWWHCQVQP